ncbi:hypothetical protein SAMD00019534_014710 [Acytostelium subglobosum LB1]|uniref:hypothetical protein n=1 Tax=Acytostelium subglobosum LB1 TaxID=1410327 RepID=UPI0006450EF3|nr:hypothetical protein SAMD00019534_014710 [Acytostelium subglobosum LB1]GAM18296.1 hypothetical protein SAMD00019534_014710 [Acytostelium subglobosum LB1]|eukprot:XP_012757516.1 hypothetical protein SAMD00019534_014710 [Acytostelium subglobosum LB1]
MIPSGHPDAPKLSPLKQLHWSKVPAANTRKTVWDVSEESIKLDFNKQILDRLFCSKTNMSRTGTHSTLRNQDKITIVDMRRSNNIGVLLSKYKLTGPWVVDIINSMSDEHLNKELVTALIKCAPTSDEEQLLQSYTGSKNILSPVDQFLVEMLKVPKIRERLNCIQYKQSFDSLFEEIINGSRLVERCCQWLLKAANLKQLLHLILNIGNYMNSGTARGNATGYRLNCLLTLSNTKSLDQSITLLNYVAKIVSDRYPHLLITSDPLLEAASRIHWKELSNHLVSLQQGMMTVQKEVERQQSTVGMDTFTTKMNQFIKSRLDHLRDAANIIRGVEQLYDTVMKYYVEDYSSPEEFFSLLHNFMTMFKQAHLDNLRDMENDKAIRPKIVHKAERIMCQRSLSTTSLPRVSLNLAPQQEENQDTVRSSAAAAAAAVGSNSGSSIQTKSKGLIKNFKNIFLRKR